MLLNLVKELSVPNLNHISVLQRLLLNFFAVHQSSVCAAQIVQDMSFTFRNDPAMLTRNGHIIKANFANPRSSDRNRLDAIQGIGLPQVLAFTNNQNRGFHYDKSLHEGFFPHWLLHQSLEGNHGFVFFGFFFLLGRSYDDRFSDHRPFRLGIRDRALSGLRDAAFQTNRLIRLKWLSTGGARPFFLSRSAKQGGHGENYNESAGTDASNPPKSVGEGNRGRFCGNRSRALLDRRCRGSRRLWCCLHY